MLAVYEHYKCVFCGYPVDPNHDSVAEEVTGWVVKGKVLRQTDRTWRFAHKVCAEAKPKNDSQSELFSA